MKASSRELQSTCECGAVLLDTLLFPQGLGGPLLGKSLVCDKMLLLREIGCLALVFCFGFQPQFVRSWGAWSATRNGRREEGNVASKGWENCQGLGWEFRFAILQACPRSRLALLVRPALYLGIKQLVRPARAREMRGAQSHLQTHFKCFQMLLSALSGRNPFSPEVAE